MGYIRTFVFVFLICQTARMVGADASPVVVDEDFIGNLGLTLEEGLARFGPPSSMFVHRGNVSEEDNIVFFYPNSWYLYWFQNRVWQIRVDSRWEGEVAGIRMGYSRNAVQEIWGEPINRTDVHPTWTLPDRGYPVRMRLFFENDALVDLYIYRSDW